jgi:hypothetical protein
MPGAFNARCTYGISRLCALDSPKLFSFSSGMVAGMVLLARVATAQRAFPELPVRL